MKEIKVLEGNKHNSPEAIMERLEVMRETWADNLKEDMEANCPESYSFDDGYLEGLEYAKAVIQNLLLELEKECDESNQYYFKESQNTDSEYEEAVWLGEFTAYKNMSRRLLDLAWQMSLSIRRHKWLTFRF